MDALSKTFLTVALIFISLGTLFIWETLGSGSVRMVFCDVGQGDGILIVTSSGKQILIDGGVGKRINGCLATNMPFWDRTIEMMVPTHFQKDHMEGQIDVFKNYQVENVVTTNVGGQSTLAVEWNKGRVTDGSTVHVPKAGEKIVVDDVTFEVVWPTDAAYSGWREKEPSDLNETSIVLRMVWNSGGRAKCTYFTGDITKEILAEVADKPCSVLKIAHHGSKTGTSDEVLDKAKPKLAVIQVGKNSYGHPTTEVLGMLSGHGVKVLRNDELGAIEFDQDLRITSDR